MIPHSDLTAAIAWYVVLLLIGLPGWLLIASRATKLPDGGYSLGKVAGLLGLATVSWLLSISHVFAFTQASLVLLVFIMWAVVLYKYQTVAPLIKRHWKNILIIEAACIVLFIIGVALRSSKAQIEGIEKYMDSAILNGLLRHEKGAPLDTWYAGKTINYYYFGHWIIAVIAKISQTPGWLAFNLGFATVVSVAGSQLIIAGWTLSRRWIGGFLVAFLALFASNIHPFIAFMQRNKSYFFFNSGRFIDYRINEYPFYSMSLGDLHAHMLSLMLTTPLAVLVILHATLTDKLKSNALLMGILLGLMAPTNAFDTISCSIIVGLVLLFKWYQTPRRPFAALWQPAAYCAAGALVPIGAFMTHFKQPTGGLGVALFKIPLLHIGWQFGVPLALLVLSLVALYRFRYFGKKQGIGALLRVVEPRKVMLGIFTITAIALIALPEVFFIKDLYFYVNPPYFLANTEFKIWYTGWVMLAIATGSSVIILLELLWQKRRVVGFGATVVVVCCLAMLCVGIQYGLKTLQDSRPNTLDGISFLERNFPDRVKAVRWAQQSIKGQPVVLEAVGDSYSEFNWFSSYTGLPTIMGWRSHEYGWRYSKDIWSYISAQEQSVKSIYQSKTVDELVSQATTYGVSFIMVGPQERSVYGAQDAVFQQAFAAPVFDSPTVDIYRVENLRDAFNTAN